MKTGEQEGRGQELVKRTAELTAEVISPEQVNRIFGCLGTWDSLSVDDKRRMPYLTVIAMAGTVSVL